MMQHVILLTIFVIGLADAARSQTRDHSWETAVQASSTNTNLIFGDSATGFRFATTWKPAPRFGLVADFASQSGSSSSQEFSFNTLMGGPRVYSGEGIRLSGFLQALGGVYKSSVTVNARKSTDWNYIWGGGAGFDIRVTNHIALRPLEYDLLWAGSDPAPLLIARVSSGVVFRFGG